MELKSIGTWLRRYQHWTGPAGIVIGALISLYFFLAAQQVGEISLKFNTVKIAQSGVPGIKISDQKNNPITSDVFGCEIIIWNTGNLSLGEKSDRAREPLTVVFLGSDVKIIDAVVQDTKNVPAGYVNVDRQANKIVVTWSQFDPGDALKVFAIYASGGRSPLAYRGRFLQTKITDLSQFEDEYPGLSGFAAVRAANEYDRTHHPFRFFMSWLLIVTMCIGIIMICFRRVRQSKWAPLIAAVFFGVLVLNSIVAVVGQFSNPNPFP